MKILMINKFLYQNGGSESYMIKLGNYLQDCGHQVQYFGMYDQKNLVGNSYGLYAPAVNYHSEKKCSINMLKTAVSTIYSKDSCKAVLQLLDKFSPDIVHLNNINFQITPAVIYPIHKKQIPIIQTVHDVQIACPCHRFFIEYRQELCEQCEGGRYWKCIKNKCLHGSAAKSTIAAAESYYYHIRGTYNLVDEYICPSKFIAGKISKAGIDERKISVMQNYCEKYHAAGGKKNSAKYVLYFGRLSIEKGILSLLKICRSLTDLRFVFAGTGPLSGEIQEAAAEYPNIRYMGYQSGDGLAELIASAHFSVCPSECYENCPMSVIESQALGIPVIGSSLGGIPELIENGKTGLIFEGCNVQKLEQAIKLLWYDDKLRNEMHENCLNKRKVTLEEYGEYMISEYKKLERS